jgi:hypothetical protein
VTERPASGWGVEIVKAVIPALIVGSFFGIGFYFKTNDDTQNTKASIATFNSYDLPNRVLKLEDQQQNTVSSFNMQISGIQTQVETLQQEDHDLNNILSGMAQDLATIKAQITFLIKSSSPAGQEAQK